MTVDGKTMLAEYAQQRDQLLAQITKSLSDDPRFVAAWLGGSFSQGNADEVSDLDLAVVVRKEFAGDLCARPEMITAWPPVARLTLFRRYGDIGLVYENNCNAPSGGTATNVMYTPTGVMVDWTLIPQEDARRPQESRLLFGQLEVPVVAEPALASPAERAKAAADTVAFFWLMTAVTAKYIIRGDHVFVVRWLEELARLAQEAERQVAGDPWQYRRGSVSELKTTRAEQVNALRMLCRQVEALSPRLVALGGEVWPEATSGIAGLLESAEQIATASRLQG